MKTFTQFSLTLKKGKQFKLIKIFILFCIILITSHCSKDSLIKEPDKVLSINSTDLQARLEGIKKSFYSQKLQEKIKPKKSDRLLWYPDWENPKMQIVNDSVSYVFYEFLAKVDGKNVNVKTTNGKLFLMVKNEKDFYKALYYNSSSAQSNNQTKEFNMDHFTGNLLLYSLQNGRNYLLDYSNGRLSNDYLKKGVLAAKKIQANKGKISYWEEHCELVIRNCTYSTLAQPPCSGGSIPVTFSPTCQWPQALCGFPFSMTDSDEAVICENVWFPDPPDPGDGGGTGGGGGGDGGEGDIPTVEVKKDSLMKHYPCMVNEVLNKLEGNQTYGKLVQPFQKIQLPNGGTLGMQGLPNLTYDFSHQDYGGGTTNYSLGTTGDYAGTSSIIRFNTEAIANASLLLLQAAAIHESGHAYANYYIKAGQYGFPVDTTRYSTWAINIVNFESVANSSIQGGNFNDHSVFLEDYYENFWGILKAVNGTAFTDKEYQMAALYGLNNPGPAPQSPIIGGVNVYEIYKGMLNKSFNNIKSKYGITDTELNSFNLVNLVNVPDNKKLPTTCP